MTPLGHAAVAYASSAVPLRAGPVSRLAVAALVIGGVLPDIDFLLFWAPNFNELHRVVTHNLLFVAGHIGHADAPQPFVRCVDTLWQCLYLFHCLY